MDSFGGQTTVEQYLQSTEARFAAYVETRTSKPQPGDRVTSDVVTEGEWLVDDPEQFLPVDLVHMGISADPDVSENREDGFVYSLEFMWKDQQVFTIIMDPNRGFVTTDETVHRDTSDDRIVNLLNRLEKLEKMGWMRRCL